MSLIMSTTALKVLFGKIAYRILIKNHIACNAPFLPDGNTDFSNGCFSMQEISVAAKSVKEIYRKPMCLLCAGYKQEEIAALLGISELTLLMRIHKGHKLFMKALKRNRLYADANDTSSQRYE